MQQKAIKIDYYEAWIYRKKDKDNYEEEKINISAIFKMLQNNSVVERTFKYGGESIRFQEINYDKENRIWEIQLLRSRDIIIPGVADNSGNYTITTLDNDKYYAESIALLYNEEKSLLAFQINHNYMTRTVLEEILNRFQEDLTEKIHLLPIIIKDKAEMVKNAKYYTKLHVVAKQGFDRNNKDTLMGKILGSAKKYEGAQFEITIGFGKSKKKKDTLNIDEVKKDIEVLNNARGIESLQIDYRSDIDTIQDTFNLIKERVQDWIYIQKDKKIPILYEDVLEKMKPKFIKRIKSGII